MHRRRIALLLAALVGRTSALALGSARRAALVPTRAPSPCRMEAEAANLVDARVPRETRSARAEMRSDESCTFSRRAASTSASSMVLAPVAAAIVAFSSPAHLHAAVVLPEKGVAMKEQMRAKEQVHIRIRYVMCRLMRIGDASQGAGANAD